MKKVFIVIANAIWLSALVMGMIENVIQTKCNMQMAKDIHEMNLDNKKSKV